MRKEYSVQQMMLSNRISTCRKIKLYLYSTPCIKINNKKLKKIKSWIRDLKIRAKT